MRYKILTLIVLCVGLTPVFAPAQERGANANSSALVKMTGEAVGIDYCSRTVGENWQEKHARLKFRLRLTNLSDRPLIVNRMAPAVFDARLGTTAAAIRQGHFHFTEHPRPNVPPRNLVAAELKTLFRVVQPNESITYEDISVAFVHKSSEEDLLKGEYLLQFKVATWLWDIEEAKRVQQQWAGYGDFFYYDVTVEPFPFTINVPEVITMRCDTQ